MLFFSSSAFHGIPVVERVYEQVPYIIIIISLPRTISHSHITPPSLKKKRTGGLTYSQRFYNYVFKKRMFIFVIYPIVSYRLSIHDSSYFLFLFRLDWRTFAL